MGFFRRILSFMKPYLLFAVLAPSFMVIEVAMDLLQPRIMENIVDIGLANMDLGYVLRMGLLMTAAAIVGVAGGAGCSYFAVAAGVGMGTDLRGQAFKRVQELSARDLDRLQAGSLITRLTNDIIQVQEISIMMLRILVRAPLLIVGSLVMAVILSPRLSLILAVLIPLLTASIVLVSRGSFPAFGRVQERLDDLNTVTRENLAGIRVVKAFIRQEHERQRFGRANTNLMEAMVRAAGIVALIQPLMVLLLNGGIILAVYFGGRLSAAGGLSTGQLMAYINYLTQLLMSLLMVSIILIRFSRAEASAGRIVEILDTVPELKSPANPVSPVREAGRIEFDRVCFSYGGDGDETDALYDVSLVLEPGTTTAVVGTTGSGKSTMLNLIPRMYDVTSGRILFDGVDVREMDLSYLRGRIGMVPQEAVLFSGTIGENISYGKPDASEAEILEAARTAQAEEFILQGENGLGTVLSQRGMNLSGGQKQRLAIARALLPDPALLVLDDSLSALDADTAARLQKALARRRRGKTTLIVAQRIAQVASCDSIIVLDNGRIVDQAPHATLVSRCGLYREIVRSQNGGEGDG